MVESGQVVAVVVKVADMVVVVLMVKLIVVSQLLASLTTNTCGPAGRLLKVWEPGTVTGAPPFKV